MAALYADEQFPFQAIECLRLLGHDVLTVQAAGNANRGVPDEAVLAFATQQCRAVLTLNRRDFIRLHTKNPNHAGIIVCKDDLDRQALAARIHQSIQVADPLAGKLLRVNKPS
jgi:tetraacyldisaccharide-1-P 4'-kinase